MLPKLNRRRNLNQQISVRMYYRKRTLWRERLIVRCRKQRLSIRAKNDIVNRAGVAIGLADAHQFPFIIEKGAEVARAIFRIRGIYWTGNKPQEMVFAFSIRVVEKVDKIPYELKHHGC